MKTILSVLLTAVLFAITPITNAALYQGTITGTANIWLDPGNMAPFSNGDPFTLTLLVDTSGLNDLDASVNGGSYQNGNSTMQLMLNIGGYTGTFGNFFVQIQNDASGATDFFSIGTALDDTSNVFNGLPNSNIGFSFYGPTSVLQSASLAQAFSFTDFNPGNISFDANGGQYAANLTMTSGNYAAVVPIPAALYLFAPTLAGLVVLGRRKKK